MTGKRFDVEGIVGIIVQCFPDLLNTFIHALFIVDEDFRAPELFLNFLPGHDLASMAGEQGQQFERQGRKLDWRPAFAQFLGGEI